jgi:hypothetical protein
MSTKPKYPSTEVLIQRLARDGSARPRRVLTTGRRLLIATVLASIPALLIIVFVLGKSPHLTHGLTATMGFSLVSALLLAIAAFAASVLLSRPETELRAALVWVPALLVLAVGVALELTRFPQSAWYARLIGGNPLGCFLSVFLLSLPVLFGVLIVLRGGAPTRPRVAGAMAGLLAGGVTSVLYVIHCPEDSLLFVGTWHVLALVFVTGFGAYLGSKWLRW